MRIVYLSSCLEPGKDGVGDYTRRLAVECIRQGYPAAILGLNDLHISEAVTELQEIEGTSVSVLRLPRTMRWNKRIIESRNWLGAFNPDWLSLQYVTFGFDPKGLGFGLGKRLAAMNAKAAWHIMFHELWVGLARKSSLKHRIWGALQRLIILDLEGRLRPSVVHTQAESYRVVLNREKIKASILPLFGNIPYVDGDGWNGLLEPLITRALGEHSDRARLYLAGVFGGVHPEWDAEQAVNTIIPLVQRFQKRLVLVFLGRSNLAREAMIQLKFTLQNRADVLMAGERTSAEISKILQTLDLGLATSPLQIIHKSGSVAAMVEHGLPVLVTRDDWRLRGTDSQPQEPSSELLTPRRFALLKELPTRDPRPPKDCGVNRVAGRMLAALKSSLGEVSLS
jgi:hypothetical protein